MTKLTSARLPNEAANCGRNESPTINAGNLSPEQSVAPFGARSDAGTAYYVSRDIDEHGHAVDCNKVRIAGWFTRRELALVLTLMPDD